MIEKQTVKKEPVLLIQRYLLPISLSTALLYFAWIILDWVANIVNDGDAFLKGLRYAGIAVTFLVLVVLGLFLAYTTLECFKFKKSMLKDRLSILIFNTLVCMVLLVLFLLVMVRVCQYGTWYNKDTDAAAYAKNGRLMGATFVFLIYISVFLLSKNKVKKPISDNVRMIKAIIWTMTFTAIASSFLMAFRTVGGFLSFQQILGDLYGRLAIAAVRAGNISIMMFGICTILVICIIPLLFIIERNDELIKRQILISALVGGISLILFVVTLAIMDQNIIQFTKQETGTTVCTILLLCNFACVVLFTIFSFINNKKFFGLYIDFKFMKKSKGLPAKDDDKNAEKEVESKDTEQSDESEPIPVVEVQEESTADNNNEDDSGAIVEDVEDVEDELSTYDHTIKDKDGEENNSTEQIDDEQKDVGEDKFVQEATEQTVENIDPVDSITPTEEEQVVIDELKDASVKPDENNNIEPEQHIIESTAQVEQELASDEVVKEEASTTKQVWDENAQNSEKDEANQQQDLTPPNVEENPTEVLSSVTIEDDNLEIKPEIIADTILISENVEKNGQEQKRDIVQESTNSIDETASVEGKNTQSEN